MSNETQKQKKKFRNSSKWLKFRKHIANKFDNKDAISGYPLRKGWNLHHLSLDNTKYEDITVEDNFVPLNKQLHETLHICYRYQSLDSGFMDRLRTYVDKMIKVNTSN